MITARGPWPIILVRIPLDTNTAAPELIGVHPATVWLRADDLAALIREHGNPVHIAEL